jgi:hypothetical protein
MAMRCPICEAENPNGTRFCGVCGAVIQQTVSHEPSPPVASQTRLRRLKSYRTSPEASTFPVANKSKKIVAIAVIAAVVIVAVAASLAYYYQPVRGRGWSSDATIVRGSGVGFSFVPSQGVGPYSYAWSFGDGSYSSLQEPRHTYSATGTYSVSVTVRDAAGMKCVWQTTIKVRLPLVFIDSVSYPQYLAALMGSTQLVLLVDGTQVSTGYALSPGTTHSIELKILWVMDFGGGHVYSQTATDDKGSVTAPTAHDNDLHCVLHYNPMGTPKFNLTAA